MKKSLFMLGFLVSIFPALMFGRGKPEAPAATAKRDDLVISVASDPVTFDLLYANTLIEGQIGNNIYDCLFHFEDDGSLTPWLGERYEVSPDGRDYTFYLRRGVRFHNGEEFTARDVEFTIEYGKGTPNGSMVCDMIAKTEVIDDYTIKVSIAEPSSSFLYEFAGDQLAIYNEEAVTSADPYGAFPIGTGAYRFVRREPGVEVELAAFEDYFMGEPSIKKVVFRIIPDDFTASVALETGDIDFIWILGAASAASLRENDALTVYAGPSTRVNYVAMNMEQPPFNNRDLRQAVNYGIDRDAIRDMAFEGESVNKDYMAMPWMAGFAEPQKRYAYDPALAVSLAAKAGVSKERPVEVKLIASTATRRVAEILQGQLAALGINLRVEILEFNAWITDYYAGNFQISAGGHYIMIRDMNYLSEFYHSDNINQGNSARFNNSEADRLFQAGRLERDLAKRIGIYSQLQEIVQEEAPYAVFGTPAIIRAYNKNLAIAKVYPNGIFLRDIAWR